MKKNLLTPIADFELENYFEFENRYTGFGKEMYRKIKQELPLIFQKLTFHKRISNQIEDSYAQCVDDNLSFAIQLDPRCEVIVLWNNQKHAEFGNWTNNGYEEAISFIKSELLK